MAKGGLQWWDWKSLFMKVLLWTSWCYQYWVHIQVSVICRWRLVIIMHHTAGSLDLADLHLRLPLFCEICLALDVIVIMQHLFRELRVVWVGCLDWLGHSVHHKLILIRWQLWLWLYCHVLSLLLSRNLTMVHRSLTMRGSKDALWEDHAAILSFCLESFDVFSRCTDQ